MDRQHLEFLINGNKMIQPLMATVLESAPGTIRLSPVPEAFILREEHSPVRRGLPSDDR